MMEVLSWNIQAARGVDGKVDVQRVASVIAAPGVPDVICLQEVAQHFPEVDGGEGADQVAALSERFPEHTPFFGAAIDRCNGSSPRRRFGNLILARPAVEQCFLHALPQPTAPGIRHMPRQATEVVVEDGAATLRIVTLHLEYHARTHRLAQVERLLALHREVCGHVEQPPAFDERGAYAASPRPATAIVCGDFNFEVDEPEYRAMLSAGSEIRLALADAWVHCHGPGSHRPTCGVHDHEQWTQGPHCRDFFFITQDLLPRVAAVDVDELTDASDHQPVRLTLSPPDA
jgi:endonuclease/exonuclease/phosphatase family metal-dependent hydrolase